MNADARRIASEIAREVAAGSVKCFPDPADSINRAGLQVFGEKISVPASMAVECRARFLREIAREVIGAIEQFDAAPKSVVRSPAPAGAEPPQHCARCHRAMRPRKLLPDPPRAVVELAEALCRENTIDLGAIRRPFRSKTIAAQRHLLVYLLRQRFPKGMDRVASFWEIAAVTGYPNASSVQWAYRAESRRRGEATRDEARN